LQIKENFSCPSYAIALRTLVLQALSAHKTTVCDNGITSNKSGSYSQTAHNVYLHTRQLNITLPEYQIP